MEKKYTGYGRVNYQNGWVVLNVRYEILRYYKYVILKMTGKKINPPQHGAHVTIVAGKYHTVGHRAKWGKWQGKRLKFTYEPKIYCSPLYYWLKIDCPEFLKIRRELGLDKPAQPWHLTIGNLKNI